MYTKNICVVTGTRADYHLLAPLLKAIDADDAFKLQLAVTGSHLSPLHGNTYADIERDGFSISVKIPILDGNDDETAVNRALANAITGFDAAYKNLKSDYVLILGDRYEALGAAAAAMNRRIPIAHLYGGETTEGAIDECIRHMITKMSYLHFTSCEPYRRRVIQLGEDPARVFNVGALGIENIRNFNRLTLSELEESVGFKLGNNFAVVTFHPATLEDGTAKAQFNALLSALDAFPNLRLLFTKSNADTGGLRINAMIDEYVERNSAKAHAVFSLGMERYLSALSYAAVVIGNSSSGIMETPSFKVPTVNIGDRQKGRVRAKNVIDCGVLGAEIESAITKALSAEFKKHCSDTVNPFGDGNTSMKIIEILKEFINNNKINLKKIFYDTI